ncbi:hypothetical protein PENTCL1PPCAC_14715, partial [Pristionchus entomophagus]
TTMSSSIDLLLDFLVRYPVLLTIFFVYCTCCSMPIIVLLIATQKIVLHLNCRNLISFWCISLLGVLTNTVMLYAEMLTYEKGFVPRGIVESPLRPYVLVGHSFVYMSSSSFEMFIAFERILPHAGRTLITFPRCFGRCWLQ